MNPLEWPALHSVWMKRLQRCSRSNSGTDLSDTCKDPFWKPILLRLPDRLKFIVFTIFKKATKSYLITRQQTCTHVHYSVDMLWLQSVLYLPVVSIPSASMLKFSLDLWVFLLYIIKCFIETCRTLFASCYHESSTDGWCRAASDFHFVYVHCIYMYQINHK